MMSQFRFSLMVLTLLVSMPFQSIGANAYLNKDVPPQSSAPAHGSAAGGIEILTDTEGVNFNSYIKEVYSSVKKRWFSNMPPSIEKGNQGVNAVEFRILQDGTVPQDFVKMVQHSGKSDLDAASLEAVREAGPFSHLPEKFSQPFVLLRFNFYYNLKPPKP